MKSVLITGVERGIGKALTKQFLKLGFVVIGTSQSGNVTYPEGADMKIIRLDLLSKESIEEAVKKISVLAESIDVLINNAGIGPDLEDLKFDFEKFTSTFRVNVEGTVFFTETLLQSIDITTVIANITSKMASINRCVRSDSIGYRMSKASLNMYTKILANRFENKVRVFSLHPGWVKTELSDHNANARLTPQASAFKIAEYILNTEETGILWDVESDKRIEW